MEMAMCMHIKYFAAKDCVSEIFGVISYFFIVVFTSLTSMLRWIPLKRPHTSKANHSDTKVKKIVSEVTRRDIIQRVHTCAQ